MDDLAQARQNVKELLAHSSSPAVLCSFGKDSILLLDLVRELGFNPPVLWFRTGLGERYARRTIREWKLTAYSWAPADVYVLQDGSQRTLVHEYGIGEDRLPVLIDLTDGNECAAQKFAIRTPVMYLPFDVLLVGWKDSDSHWVKGEGKLAQDGFRLGNSRVYAPLRHMSDDAVRAAVIDRRIPFEPTPDELPLCTHCVTTVPVEAFRSRYNLTPSEEVNNGTRVR